MASIGSQWVDNQALIRDERVQTALAAPDIGKHSELIQVEVRNEGCDPVQDNQEEPGTNQYHRRESLRSSIGLKIIAQRKPNAHDV